MTLLYSFPFPKAFTLLFFFCFLLHSSSFLSCYILYTIYIILQLIHISIHLFQRRTQLLCIMFGFFYLFSICLCFMCIIYYIHFALSSNVIHNHIFYIIYIILRCDCVQFQSFSKLVFLVFLYCFPLYLIFWIGIFRLFSMCKNSRHDVQIQTTAMKNPFHSDRISAPAHTLSLVFHSRCFIYIIYSL